MFCLHFLFVSLPRLFPQKWPFLFSLLQDIKTLFKKNKILNSILNGTQLWFTLYCITINSLLTLKRVGEVRGKLAQVWHHCVKWRKNSSDRGWGSLSVLLSCSLSKTDLIKPDLLKSFTYRESKNIYNAQVRTHGVTTLDKFQTHLTEDFSKATMTSSLL